VDNGINNYLKRLASSMLIKNNSITGINISRSLAILNGNLRKHFASDVAYVKVFGSYSRGTILPREFDMNSDVDVLIGFATESMKLKPESYRERLKRFAEMHYPKARIVKDHPSIVVELNHINFDLVPSVYDRGWIWDSIEIPDKNGGWMETEPDAFGRKLSEANRNYYSIVKPVVRLLKAWNASHGYPYSSFDLESAIVDMSFGDYSYERGFLDAVHALPTYSIADSSAKKVESLQRHATRIRTNLERQQIEKAKAILKRIIPSVA
jgi:predicted nucleotidyltransferase